MVPSTNSQVCEDTPLSDLTDTQISNLTAKILDEGALSKPLIGRLETLNVLAMDYIADDIIIRDKLKWLEHAGFTGCRRIRPDGDCFYRAFAICFVLSSVKSSSPLVFLQQVQSLLPLLDAAGFEKYIYEEFSSPLIDILSGGSNQKSEDEIFEIFNDTTVSTSIVVFLRLLTSAFLRSNEQEYYPFLFESDRALGEDGLPDMVTFCRNEVESMSKEADHLQIAALSKALRMKVQVAYLDRSNSSQGKVDIHEFTSDDVLNPDSAITLLYKPGHYDILIK